MAPRDVAVPELAGSGGPTGVNHVEAIRVLFADVLGVSEVGPGEHFLGIGGNLAAANRLVRRIRAELGMELVLRDFLKDPTPAGLAVRFGAPAAILVELSDKDDVSPTECSQGALNSLGSVDGDAAIQVEITERLRRITPTFPPD